MSPKTDAKLAEHYHYIDFLQRKVKWAFDAFSDAFPSFEAEIKRGHESHALKIRQNAVGESTPGVTISMTTDLILDRQRPLPDHECMFALDTLIIDLKRMMIFSLSTVELAAGFNHNTNRSFETFFGQCTLDYEQMGNQRSKLAKLVLNDNRASEFACFIHDNMSRIRKLNSQRVSLEHIDLYYGAVHRLKLK